MDQDGKAADKKMKSLIENLQAQFRVEGIIGHGHDDQYRDIPTFIRGIAEWKEDSDVTIPNMIEKRLDLRLKDVFTKIETKDANNLELIRIQETEFQNLRTKLEAIEDDVAEL